MIASSASTWQPPKRGFTAGDSSRRTGRDRVVHDGEAHDRDGLPADHDDDDDAGRAVHQRRMDDPRRVREQQRLHRDGLRTADDGRTRQRPAVGTQDDLGIEYRQALQSRQRPSIGRQR
jgi:hypothetical protein